MTKFVDYNNRCLTPPELRGKRKKSIVMKLITQSRICNSHAIDETRLAEALFARIL